MNKKTAWGGLSVNDNLKATGERTGSAADAENERQKPARAIGTYGGKRRNARRMPGREAGECPKPDKMWKAMYIIDMKDIYEAMGGENLFEEGRVWAGGRQVFRRLLAKWLWFI